MVAAVGYEEATKDPKTKYSEERRNVIHGIEKQKQTINKWY